MSSAGTTWEGFPIRFPDAWLATDNSPSLQNLVAGFASKFSLVFMTLIHISLSFVHHFPVFRSSKQSLELNMVLPPYMNSWSEFRKQQDKLKQAANHLLEDMQRCLPNPLDPTTVSAMKNYMVTRYGQTEDYDKRVMRHDAIKILIEDVERRLAELNTRANDLAVAHDQGITGEGDLLQRYGFSEANFRQALDQIINVRARLSVCDSEYMILQTRNESLEEDKQLYKSLLEMSTQHRAQEKHEEIVRGERLSERVKTEYKRLSRTTDYVIHQANDLERRLQETEKLYQGAKHALDLVMWERSQQDQMSTDPEMPALARSKTWPTRTDVKDPSLNLQRKRESKQDTPVESESRQDSAVVPGSRFGLLLSRLISGISEEVVNSLRQIGEASVVGWRPPGG